MSRWLLQSVSLLLAVCFWYYVTTDVSTVTLTVPIDVRNVRDNKILVSEYEPQAKVRLSGPSFMIANVSSSPPVFRLKVPTDTDNRVVMSLEPDELSLPTAVTVISVEPEEIELLFDDKASKDVPLEVPQLGSLEGSLTLDGISVNPRRVTVSGPKSRIDKIARIETWPVDLRGIRKDTRLVVPLRKPAGPGIELSGESASALVRVSVVSMSKRFVRLPVEIRSLDGAQFQLAPRTVDVEVSAVRDAAESLTREKVIPFVRLGSESVVGARVAVQAEVPPGVSVEKIEPPEVAVGLPTPSPESPRGGPAKPVPRSGKKR